MQTWHSPHTPPVPLKLRVSGHVTLFANFLQDVAACFSEVGTLTTLSKRSLQRATYRKSEKHTLQQAVWGSQNGWGLL